MNGRVRTANRRPNPAILLEPKDPETNVADKATIALVLSPEFPGPVGDLPMDQLRSRRQQCEIVESELSYRRRVLHGHLDLLRAELARRDGDGSQVAIAQSLLDRESATARSPSHQRLALDVEDDELGPVSADLPDCDDAELRSRGEAWVTRERELSDHRRTVLERLDLIQDEIVRRYRDGSATIDDILPSRT